MDTVNDALKLTHYLGSRTVQESPFLYLVKVEEAAQALYESLKAVQVMLDSQGNLSVESLGRAALLEVVSNCLEKTKPTLDHIVEAYFVVDDYIDELNGEGFEVLYGNPYTAVGYKQGAYKTLREAISHIRRYSGDHRYYRVFLSRRHGSKARVEKRNL